MESSVVMYAAGIFLTLLAVLSFLLLKKTQTKEPQEGPKLPPGSMGWPYVGETLKLFSQNPSVFFDTRYIRSLYLSIPQVKLHWNRSISQTDATIFNGRII